MDESLCLMFVGRDGHTSNAEHQQQWWRPIYIVYGPSHDRYAQFAMLAVFGASAAEVWALLISSDNLGGFGSVTFESQAIPHLLIPGFLHCTSVGMVWGTFSSLGAFAESVGNMPNYPLQFYYQLVVLPHRKSRLFSELRTSRRNPYSKPVYYVIHVKLRDSRKTTWFT